MSAARLTKPNHQTTRQADQLRLVAPEGGGVVRPGITCSVTAANLTTGTRYDTQAGTSRAGRWRPFGHLRQVGTGPLVACGPECEWRPTTLGRVSNPDRAPAEVTCDGREGAGRKDPVVLPSREVPLGGPRAMLVRRSLPQRERSLIGA